MNLSFSDLNGKVCVITGGNGVLGKYFVDALANVGAKIAILDRIVDENISNENIISLKSDVLDKNVLLESKKIINEKWGSVDILINAAGGNSPKATTKIEALSGDDSDNLDNSFFGIDTDGFKFVFDLNIIGTVLPSMVFGTDMVKQKKGAILNISSMNAFKPLTKIPAYSGAKCAINNFTEWLAVHLAKTGVRVNAIAPGFFLTNQNRFLLTDEKTGELTERGHKILNNTPMGRFGEPEELQGSLLFLLSDVSKFITGVIIPVDGGFNAFSGV